MTTAGDIGARNERHHRRVVTHRPRAETLSEVGVEIDSAHLGLGLTASRLRADEQCHASGLVGCVEIGEAAATRAAPACRDLETCGNTLGLSYAAVRNLEANVEDALALESVAEDNHPRRGRRASL